MLFLLLDPPNPRIICSAPRGYNRDPRIATAHLHCSSILIVQSLWYLLVFAPLCFHPSCDMVSFDTTGEDDITNEDVMLTAASDSGDWDTFSPPEQPVRNRMDSTFFPLFHDKIWQSWLSPCLAQSHAAGSHPLSSVDGAHRLGYTKLTCA